ncbi:divergent polysaccharide deacetylase family protein [Heliophilum fasciatum]|uniref:MurNAc-LAA domain-containing protein n=1 Tax=Heliophilum fasciatum TaxID=35700 RepID=A0A4R2SCZ7_9FIRM|nr:divergent polysaccharide deacetylase family protein [Heliophilum fasciatum]MCW2276612.1 polysaccharide deacetylase 2 family uncharacterized protein YibQ/N-acetylmuramoyl-L-alanine amidase [Heliophilum fasciatum]TCP69005.1 hypothetical protein EDD73_101173 [Heliophilum fasciatum]
MKRIAFPRLLILGLVLVAGVLSLVGWALVNQPEQSLSLIDKAKNFSLFQPDASTPSPDKDQEPSAKDQELSRESPDSAPPPKDLALPYKSLQGKRILLDVGHGGSDSGAGSTQSQEKDINLEVARALKTVLEHHGAAVFLSRDADQAASSAAANAMDSNQSTINQRIAWANNTPGDLLIGLHMGTSRNNKVRGSLLLYDQNNSFATQSQKAADVLQKELTAFYSRYVNAGDIYKHKPADGNFPVLRQSPLPSVTLEMGFLSNEKDRALFLQPDFQKALTERIAYGAGYYFSLDAGQLAQMAIIIDDLGNNADGTNELLELGCPITVAIMPFMHASAKESALAHERNFEVLIHLSLEAERSVSTAYTPNTITTALADDQIRKIINEAKASVPHAIGLNNHMGSKATADTRVMSVIAEQAKENDWLLVDSSTSQNSQMSKAAGNFGVPFACRDFFIDNEHNYASSVQSLMAAAADAKRTGNAVVIGHVGPDGGKSTVKAIRDSLPKIQAMGIELVPISKIAK